MPYNRNRKALPKKGKGGAPTNKRNKPMRGSKMKPKSSGGGY